MIYPSCGSPDCKLSTPNSKSSTRQRHLQLTFSPPPTMMAPNNGSFPLSTELIIHIFCELPLLSDVFALAATCSQFRGVCITYITPIYNEVAPRSIACHQHARRFLAVQGGPALEAPMTWQDVVRMARNADVVAKAVLQFQREIVCKVRSKYSTTVEVCCT